MAISSPPCPQNNVVPTYPLLELQLPEDYRECYATGHSDWRLRGLSRLNVFIGPNNSGKSRLIRALFAKRLLFAANTSEHADIRRLIDKLKSLGPWDRPKIQAFLDKLEVPLSSEDGSRVKHPSEDITQKAAAIYQGYSNDFNAVNNEDFNCGDAFRRIAHLVEQSQQQQVQERKFKKVYIPTLRGLRSPGTDTAAFRNQTLKDYFSNVPHFKELSGTTSLGPMVDTPIFTGLEVYDEIQQHLLGTLGQRKLVREFEHFLSVTFFSGQAVTLIPRLKSSLHVKIGNAAEQPIHNLGDGIQQIIILTLPMYLHQNKELLLFVEEPELFLHPGFQRIWIETVLSRPHSLQVFVATHSHQFMDITVDSSLCTIYKVSSALGGDGDEQAARHRIDLTSSKDFSVLRELGVRNSSVLLSNCTIWVEGITDRLYLRRYLDLLKDDLNINPSGRAFTEDLHYSFVEYGGSAITHFSFLSDEGIDVERLCGRLFLVADRDEGKEARHERLRARLAERCCILDCIEVENLLSPSVISRVVSSYEGDDVVLNMFNQDDYIDIRLGNFIEETVLTSESRRRSKTGSPYKDASGTVKDKTDFCSRAIQVMKSADDVSEPAKTLAKAIFAFVAANNS